MTYLIIAILLLLLELLYFRIADKFDIIDKPNQRSSHTYITLRGGGIIFLLGMWIYSFFYGIQYPYFLLGLTIIAGVSFIDDVHSVPNKVRLFIQFVAMFLLFHEWGILTLSSWWMMLIALVVCVGVINAYNFMDGINGITGAYSLAVLLPLWILNKSINFIDANLLIVASISILIFLIFNFRKRAKCFAGDVGAVGIAFILLFAIGSLIIKTRDLSYIFLLTIYGVDTILTIIHRILLHENIGVAHRKHAYQLMANELKMPHVVVSSIYMVLQLLISAGLIWFPWNSWIYCISVTLVMTIVYVLFMKRYYYLHVAYLKNKDIEKFFV